MASELTIFKNTWSIPTAKPGTEPGPNDPEFETLVYLIECVSERLQDI